MNIKCIGKAGTDNISVLITPSLIDLPPSLHCTGILVGEHPFPYITMTEFWHAGKFK